MACYGVAIGFGERSAAPLRGTAVGGPLGFLVPGLGSAGLAAALSLAPFAGLAPAVAAELVDVVLVTLAAFLLLAAVRLHDLSASLR